MSPPIDDKTINALITDPRWSARVRADEPLLTIRKWDHTLQRKPRILVPINVQALYVPQESRERFVRLPFATTTPDGHEPEAMPEFFDPGENRPAGVHLHWAMPDSLLEGTLDEREAGSSNSLSLAALPDRWVVLRLTSGRNAIKAKVAGWVIEADTTRVTRLENWPSSQQAAPATGKTIPADQLTGTVGGNLNWSGCYDAVENRFGFHDPLKDLADLEPNGVVDNLASYIVCGWWSSAKLDPLDVVKTKAGLQSRLKDLKWRLTDDLDDRGNDITERANKLARQSLVGLNSAERYKTLSLDQDTVAKGVNSSPGNTIGGLFAETADKLGTMEALVSHSSLLHGVVHGVPVDGPVVADQRPSALGLEVGLGFHSDDLAAVFAADGLNLAKVKDRRDMERLVSGFTNDLLAGVSMPNGFFTIEENEHLAAFSARPGEPGPVERVLAPGTGSELRGTRAARSSKTPKLPGSTIGRLETEVFWSKDRKMEVGNHATETMHMLREEKDRLKQQTEPPVSRLIRRPTPRYFEPLEPMLAVRGAKRNLRHRFDAHRSADGHLQCRWPSQASPKIPGLIDGADLVEKFPTGGIPQETLGLVYNAALNDPYTVEWRASSTAKNSNLEVGAIRNRMLAETALRFKKDGSYSSGGVANSLKQRPFSYGEGALAAALHRFSLMGGVDPDPVSVTPWSQPWVPMWLEWEVEILTTDRLEGWKLGPVDLEFPDDETPLIEEKRTLSGRSPLHTGVASTLSNAIKTWLESEDERDTDNQGEVSDEIEDQLARIAGSVKGIDILAASLDSLHDQLLGLPIGPYGVLNQKTATGVAKPKPKSVPELLTSGRLNVKRARIVDAFGRTLDLPATKTLFPARDVLKKGGIGLRPRILRPARWMFRLIDPADLTNTSPEATIDQLQTELMINPVAGFLLPDHIDEALEVFDTAGKPLGQLFHDPISGGVKWEIAPGREGPPDAGPSHDLKPQQQLLGHISAALVAEDAKQRQGLTAAKGEDTALSALLRAIDTTLWSMDTYAVLGSTHIAGLVGRPIAVVRATLRLDINDDLDELEFATPQDRQDRKDAYADLADRAFPVRIGEITRDDDGVLGFFVDDDFSRYHVVDKVVRDAAMDGGRGRGHLGLLGTAPQVPPTRPINHPFIVAEDEIRVRPGQTVRFTILMHPGGKCHLTSGILPRKSLQLSRDWIHKGLATMAPSARIGPVLLDKEKVRLPLISSFGKKQIWTRRDNNYTWKDDPILAATQTALLPEMPSTIEEGFIRISPVTGSDTEE